MFYPGLPADPGHALARKQMSDFGGVLCVRSRRRQGAHVGVHRRARAVHDDGELGLDGVARAPVKLYLGSDLSAEEQTRAQIKESTVRFAVGIEHVDDLIADIEQAFAKTFR